MADYQNKIVVLQDGKLTKIGPSDNLQIGGNFTANSLAGDGSSVTSIAQANVVDLVSDLSTLTSAAATAQSTADSAASAASAAQSTADSAASAAAAAQATADSAASAASAAQGDATQALSDAAAAQSTANSASSAAAAAQSTADSAASAAAAAQSTADGAASAASAAQSDATQAISDAAAAASAAAAAQSTADGAASAASAAQSTADSAASAAAAAQSTADGASSAAAAAQSTADSAASAAAAAQGTADSAASAAAAAQATADAALPLAGGTLTGALAGTDLSLSGDLTVQGNIVSKGQVDVIISDSFLDLNSGNVGSSATAGGFTVNVKKATGFTAEEATAFVAGVSSVSAPSMTISGSSLVAGDIVQVSNSVGGKNDGIYVVAGVAGSVVSIKGVGGTFPSAQVPFVQNQLIAGSGETAIVVKVDLAAIAVSNGSLQSASGAIAAGLLCYSYAPSATESDFEGGWSVLASTASSSLQSAYDNGDGAIDLSSGKDFEINSAGDGSADVVLNPHIVIGSSIGQKKQVEAGVDAGDIVFLDSDGVCKKASSTTFSEALYVALEATGGSQALKKVDFLGEMKVGIVGTAPSIKDTLFLSETAGKASKVAPTNGSVVSLGACVGASAGGLYPVRFQVGMPVAV